MRFFILFALLGGVHLAHGLKCYTCASTSEQEDTNCLNDPEAVTTASAITNCNKKYCYIVRQEYVDPIGKVASLSRTCIDEPAYKNDVIEDSTYRTYFKACQEDLCNGGTGTDISVGTANQDNGKAMTLFVPGIGSAATVFVSLSLLLITQMFLYLR